MVANDATKVTRKKSRKGTLFPFVNSAARQLGVHRITLYRVLKGHYPDRQSLRPRYAAFVAARKQR
jgi:hypothetical protein